MSEWRPIETTATFTGSVEICIDYSGVSYGNESNLKLLHFDDVLLVWDDVTTSLDTLNDIICGSVTSFSPFLVAESNVAPEVLSVTLPSDPIALGNSIAISAEFTDDNPGDTHTATIDWDDGQVASGIVTAPSGPTPGVVSGTHDYVDAGVYTITVTVTEDVDPSSDLSDSRSSAEETTTTFVVVYDADGGFVTGGGWIDSPAGAYLADPSMTGKANFGFVSKYKKGASVAHGEY